MVTLTQQESLGPKADFRGQDLNLRPPGYEPGELPLLHPGVCLLLALAAAVAAEQAGRRELAELVPDHVLGHEQLDEGPAVVDHERVADELRHDRAVARPRLDRLTVPRRLL